MANNRKLIRCVVKSSFGMYQQFQQGEIREFAEEEILNKLHLIEPVENSMNKKPDKKYKKGKNKAK